MTLPYITHHINATKNSMTDQPTPPASTPTLTHPLAPGKNAAPAKTVAPGKKAAPGKRTAPVAKDTARTGQPGTETNKDRAIHFDVGPLEIDIPRTLGYYGGISAAVAVGVLEPPVAVFIAALPVVKMLGTRVAPAPLRFFVQILQGAGKPVGGDGQGTIRLNDPDRARHDIDHITSGNAPSKNPAKPHPGAGA